VLVDGRRFLIVGHRGAAARAPENTAVSLTAGLAAGADLIEVDVGLTRDGRVVLLHDTTLNRTTSGRGRLRGTTWDQVAKLDAGSWHGRKFAGEPPIDLDDALAIVRAHVPLIVEIKATVRERESGIDPADRDTVDGVLAAFERTGGLRGVTISSAAWSLLEYASKRARGVDLALTVGSSERRDPVAWAQRIGATALHPNKTWCSPEFVRRARGLGLLVIAYTVNRTGELAPLLASGVDGVFTDDPAGMRRLVGRASPRVEPRGTLTLGIDQGSGGSRAVLVDAAGAIVAAGEARVATHRDASGAIVQDPLEIAGSIVRAAGPIVAGATLRVGAAGLAVQRSSILVWRRKDAKPLTPVLSWRAGASWSIPSALAGREAEVARATGLTARFPYGAVRLAALCASTPDIAKGLDEGRYVAGPLGSFLVERLTGTSAPSCDPSLAQRTLAWDLAPGSWSDELAEATGTKPSWWPAVAASFTDRGFLKLGRARVRLRALLGDVGAAVRGTLDDASFDAGVVVLGTGGFVIAPPDRSPSHVPGLLTSLLYEDVAGPMYALEGTVHGLAASLIEAGRHGGWETLPVERIAARSGAAKRGARVHAEPEGTGTPHWKIAPRFEVVGDGHRPEEIVRGTIDDLALHFGTIARLMKKGGIEVARFVATGGIAGAPHVTTAVAKALGLPLSIDRRPYRTAVGAALLARDGR
jgi:glycerol kinase/glycerophosphoryl diester phosphodiesterase